jgi:hypothetical protein
MILSFALQLTKIDQANIAMAALKKAFGIVVRLALPPSQAIPNTTNPGISEERLLDRQSVALGARM